MSWNTGTGQPTDRRAGPAQRTGAGAPGSVDNPDLVVDVLGRTVVPRRDVGGLVMTALGAGVISTAVVEAVGVGVGAGALLPEEHDVAVAASATAISRRRLNGQVE